MKPLDRLTLKQINRRMEAIRSGAAHSKIQIGWIRYLREAFGMTLKDLAVRNGVTVSTIQHAEKNEVSGAITVKRLKQIAESMDCEFVYSFVPKASIQQVLQSAARNKARRLLQVADSHMSLEDQKVNKDLEERIEQLAASLLEKGDIW